MRTLEGEAMAKHASKRGGAQAVEVKAHRSGAADKVARGEQPRTVLGDVNLDEGLEGEAGDDYRLRC